MAITQPRHPARSPVGYPSGGVPRSCVLICTLPRSGSWLLAEGLRSTGSTGRPAEYFRQDYVEAYMRTGVLQYDRPPLDGSPERRRRGAARDDAERGILTMVAAVLREASTPNRVCAIKLHWGQFAALLRRLRALPEYAGVPAGQIVADVFPDPRHIRLVRRDKARQALSFERALRSGTWWRTGAGGVNAEENHLGKEDGSAEEDDLAEEDDFDFDRVQGLERMLRRNEHRWDAYFAELDDDSPVVTYEELQTDFEASVRGALTATRLWRPRMTLATPSLRRQADVVTDRSLDAYLAERRRRTPWPTPWAAPKGQIREPTMRADVITVDNFYSDPQAVRAYALRQEYYFPYQRDIDVRTGRRRASWLSSRFKSAGTCPFKSSPALIAALEAITGDKIDLEHWRRDFPTDAEGKPAKDCRRHKRSCVWNCAFHLKPANGQKLGDGVHNHLTDGWNGVGVDGWAGLLYLTPDAPLSGGLKLWRNRNPDNSFDWMTPSDNWELVDEIGNVPNRLILARGNMPHSGAAGWGSTLEDGRLYQTFFFRVLPKPRTVSVQVST
jgi:LPS sulfotransferase NodH